MQLQGKYIFDIKCVVFVLSYKILYYSKKKINTFDCVVIIVIKWK